MRNIYANGKIIKLLRPRQLYRGFAVSGHGSWSKSQYLKGINQFSKVKKI